MINPKLSILKKYQIINHLSLEQDKLESIEILIYYGMKISINEQLRTFTIQNLLKVEYLLKSFNDVQCTRISGNLHHNSIEISTIFGTINCTHIGMNSQLDLFFLFLNECGFVVSKVRQLKLTNEKHITYKEIFELIPSEKIN